MTKRNKNFAGFKRSYSPTFCHFVFRSSICFLAYKGHSFARWFLEILKVRAKLAKMKVGQKSIKVVTLDICKFSRH